jgi:AcrR family transcriptional regulator
VSTQEAPEPNWSRPEPGARNARFSREKIAGAALEIARKDGVQAVSMRRVASELGAGTMTLYHYVANKRELFELMHDAMMAQLIVPEEELERGWRPALRAIAQASLTAWRSHRWQREETTQTPVFGPNGMRHFEQSLKAVAGTGLPRDRRMEIVAQVDEYVLGFAEAEVGFSSPGLDEWEEKWGDYLVAVSAHLQGELDAGDFPHIEEFMAGEDFETVIRRMVLEYSEDDRFERGLERLLDGVEMEIEREGGGPS